MDKVDGFFYAVMFMLLVTLGVLWGAISSKLAEENIAQSCEELGRVIIEDERYECRRIPK